MVSLSEIRKHNASLKSHTAKVVAVFVGGTSGIGLSTAREFVRNTTSPHVYLIGRNEAEATRIIPEFRDINQHSQIFFIKSDVSLLKNVDEACKEIQRKEKKVNLLFMTVGYVTTSGRTETAEGLDRKFSLHYYARMRFAQNLSNLLTAAATDGDTRGNLSRVVSVLDPKQSRNAALDFSDLSLKHSFSLRNCAAHACAMNSFAMEHFAHAQPGTAYVHAYPSMVHTGAFRDAGFLTKGALTVLMPLLKPFTVDLKESGERHLFAATAPRFTPRAWARAGDGVARGRDGVVGSGAYDLDWTGEVLGNSQNVTDLRASGAVEKIWKHTEEVFSKICEGEGRY